jgi:hypothetical protein
MPGVGGGGLPARIFRDFILRAEGDQAFLPEPPPAKPRANPVIDALGGFVSDVVRSLKGLFGGD